MNEFLGIFRIGVGLDKDKGRVEQFCVASAFGSLHLVMQHEKASSGDKEKEISCEGCHGIAFFWSKTELDYVMELLVKARFCKNVFWPFSAFPSIPGSSTAAQ